MASAWFLAGLLAVVAGQDGSNNPLTPGQIVRFLDQRAPVGVDPASYVAMVEALARREVGQLGRLIGTGKGFLVERDVRAQVLSVSETMVRVKILPGGTQSGRDGYLGPQWVEVLPLAGESRVDPKIKALTELRERRANRTQAEQEILSEVFRSRLAETLDRRTAFKPVLPALIPPLIASPSEALQAIPQAAPPAVVAPAAGNATSSAALPAQTPLASPELMPASPASALQLPGVPVAIVAPPEIAPAKKGHHCGAPTKSGGACRRYVVNGKRCYQHGG